MRTIARLCLTTIFVLGLAPTAARAAHAGVPTPAAHVGLLALATPGALPGETVIDDLPVMTPLGVALRVVLVLGTYGLLWLLFYLLLYPRLLTYYDPDYCKSLFWSLLFLYGIAWTALSLYLVFDYGFRWEMTRWAFVFLGGLWLIWFAIVMFWRKPA